MRKIYAAILPVMLAGCNATMQVVPNRDLISITPDMVSDCAPLKKFEGKTVEDLIQDDVDVRGAAELCAAQNHNKAELIKKLLGE
jgi:hypothetical protein